MRLTNDLPSTSELHLQSLKESKRALQRRIRTRNVYPIERTVLNETDWYERDLRSSTPLSAKVARLEVLLAVCKTELAAFCSQPKGFPDLSAELRNQSFGYVAVSCCARPGDDVRRYVPLLLTSRQIRADFLQVLHDRDNVCCNLRH